MTEAIDFLRALSGLLDDGSAGVEPAELIETARLSLETLRLAEPSADFVLTPGGINWGARPVENGAAAWMDRLRDEGVAVLAPPNDAIAFDRWVRGLVDQVGTAAATARMSAVAVATSPRATGLVPTPAQARELDVDLEPAPTAEVPQMTSAPVGAVCVQEEADRVRRIHEAAGSGVALSAVDVSAVVETLAGLLDRDALSARVDLVATLDEYTTAHSINTALLSMKLARALGYDDAALRGIGGAGLLHDVGKVRLGDLPSVSRQMLSPEERGVLQSHT
ncbi:MAG: HD domain-containing protein, partial [Gemmatimonadetes bacterium]|nr:HD domain-containing protein [Gemmatimonadota bacterium]